MAQDDTESRIRYIAGLMAENKWPSWPESLTFRRELAASWGCAESTVRGYAAEAHRIISLDPDDRDQLREQIARRMKRIADEAETAQSKITGLPDYASAIKAIDMYAKYSGIELEQKVKLSGSVGLEDLDALRRKVIGEANGES